MTDPVAIAVTAGNDLFSGKAQQLAKQLHLPYVTAMPTATDQYDYVLSIDDLGLALHSCLDKKLKPLRIDFLQGKSWHRYQYGGGKGQLIAKACGIKAQQRPTIIDVTAGLGSDAFVLASLGCRVTMVERNPIIAALLADAIARLNAAQEKLEQPVILQLQTMDARCYLTSMDKPFAGVIYLDPMHPLRAKSALVKKEMRMIRDIVGADNDAQALLQTALQCQAKRVVVKRPRLAEPLAMLKPSLQFIGRSTRFDVYY